MRKKVYIALFITLLILPGAMFFMSKAKAAKAKINHSEAVEKYKAKVEPVLKAYCRKQNISFPPKHLFLVGLKEEKELRLYALDVEATENDKPKLLHKYDILAASGEAGPKLKQGDWQVPEGFYKVEAFNPNSKYHLALRVNYPNQEDRQHALADKRADLGSDIMIHGSNASVGCLAMGDEAIEEIYVLTSEVGRENTDIILAPCNLAKSKPQIVMSAQPAWLSSLYKRLGETLKKFS